MGAHICYISIFSDSKSKVEISIFSNVGRPTFENESGFLTVFPDFLSENESVPLTFVEVKQDRQVGP